MSIDPPPPFLPPHRCMPGPPPPPFGSNFDGYFQLRLPVMGGARCLEATSNTWAAGRNYVRLSNDCTSVTPANSWAATRWAFNGSTYTQASQAERDGRVACVCRARVAAGRSSTAFGDVHPCGAAGLQAQACAFCFAGTGLCPQPRSQLL